MIFRNELLFFIASSVVSLTFTFCFHGNIAAHSKDYRSLFELCPHRGH